MEQVAKVRGRPGRKPKAPAGFQTVEKPTENLSVTQAEASVVQETQPVERPPMRPVMRAEDPRAEADRYAAELLSKMGGQLDEGVDDYKTPPPPPGWEYQWKRHSVFNQPDISHQNEVQRVGWKFVPVSRHPEMMAGNTNHKGVIERKGMYLMELPKQVVDIMRDKEKHLAKQQVIGKQQQLGAAPAGTFDRSHPQSKPRISTGYEPIQVPSDS